MLLPKDSKITKSCLINLISKDSNLAHLLEPIHSSCVLVVPTGIKNQIGILINSRNESDIFAMTKLAKKIYQRVKNTLLVSQITFTSKFFSLTCLEDSSIAPPNMLITEQNPKTLDEAQPLNINGVMYYPSGVNTGLNNNYSPENNDSSVLERLARVEAQLQKLLSSKPGRPKKVAEDNSEAKPEAKKTKTTKSEIKLPSRLRGKLTCYTQVRKMLAETFTLWDSSGKLHVLMAKEALKEESKLGMRYMASLMFGYENQTPEKKTKRERTIREQLEIMVNENTASSSAATSEETVEATAD
jgi:hypothetical protein